MKVNDVYDISSMFAKSEKDYTLHIKVCVRYIHQFYFFSKR